MTFGVKPPCSTLKRFWFSWAIRWIVLVIGNRCVIIGLFLPSCSWICRIILTLHCQKLSYNMRWTFPAAYEFRSNCQQTMSRTRLIGCTAGKEFAGRDILLAFRRIRSHHLTSYLCSHHNINLEWNWQPLRWIHLLRSPSAYRCNPCWGFRSSDCYSANRIGALTSARLWSENWHYMQHLLMILHNVVEIKKHTEENQSHLFLLQWSIANVH